VSTFGDFCLGGSHCLYTLHLCIKGLLSRADLSGWSTMYTIPRNGYSLVNRICGFAIMWYINDINRVIAVTDVPMHEVDS